jgi:hypothetical protein
MSTFIYRIFTKHYTPLLSSFPSLYYYPIKMSQPNITLYTMQTPNGIKISIALEELGYDPWVALLTMENGTDNL